MAVGWDGADPVQQDDGNTFYELGAAATVNGDITITGIRVWHGASSSNLVGRSARVWSAGGSLLEAVAIDAMLPAGWTQYDLAEPVPVTDGDGFIVSYATHRYYGAVTGGMPNDSADGLISYASGLFRETQAGQVPNTPTAAFYGVDVVYEAGIGGNQAPDITVAVTPAGLDVTAVVTVVDESPASVEYRYHWGDGSSTVSLAETVQHTYAAPGLYAVHVVATDSGGEIGTAAAPVVVAGTGRGVDVDAVLTELAARLDTVAGLEVFDHVPEKITATPAAIVAMPDTLVFDAAGRRRTDRVQVPILLVIPRRSSREAQRAVREFASGQGARSLKVVLEGPARVGGYVSIQGLIVKDEQWDVVMIGGIEYLAIVAMADVLA